jgi:hypothetical protein
MRRRWSLLGCVAVVWLGACGAGEEEPLAASCTDRAQVERALAAAPEPVVLPATTAADLQNLGTSLTAVAESLEGDPSRAAQLGYLIGAVRKGLAKTAGTGNELGRRLERSGAEVRDALAQAELVEGVRAGERSG